MPPEKPLCPKDGVKGDLPMPPEEPRCPQDEVKGRLPIPLEGPLCPQDVVKRELEGKIKNNKIFTVFNNYLASFDGRRKTYSKEEVGNVARLLYQVDENVNDCSLLWQPESVAMIRRRFFKGNNFRESPKQPGTLTHYLCSYTSFLKFAKSYSLSQSSLITIEQQDINAIDATLVNIRNWRKIINRDRRRRAHEIRLCDKQLLIAPEAYQRVLDCDESLRVRNDFLQLSADSVITDDIFIEFRDYLILSVFTSFHLPN
jgi:hypothetical protein